MPPFHGIQVTETAMGTRTLKPVATAIIGLLAIAEDADALAFPLDTPVLVTDIRTAISKAGTEGTLKGALEAIADQTTPFVVVVRVADAVDPADRDANLIGDYVEGIGTGAKALLAAEAQLGVRPRILGAPGLDRQAVIDELIIVAKKLRGFVYARAIGNTVDDAIVFRNLFAARELMLIWPNWSARMFGDAVARAMGLRAKIDQEIGWHKSISNVAVDGVHGLTRDVHFDLTDPTTTAGLANDNEITTMVRLNGSRYWGNRTTSGDPIWAFETRVRTSQALQDQIANGLAWAIDKPLNPQLARDIAETINAEFRRLKAEGRIIGGAVLPLDPNINTAASLAAGRIAIDYEFTDAAPAESLALTQRVTDRFYQGFDEQVGRFS